MTVDAVRWVFVAAIYWSNGTPVVGLDIVERDRHEDAQRDVEGFIARLGTPGVLHGMVEKRCVR